MGRRSPRRGCAAVHSNNHIPNCRRPSSAILRPGDSQLQPLLVPQSQTVDAGAAHLSEFLLQHGEPDLELMEETQMVEPGVVRSLLSSRMSSERPLPLFAMAAASSCFTKDEDLRAPLRGYINRWPETEVGLAYLEAPYFPIIVGLATLLLSNSQETQVRRPVISCER